ncbi:hypothetical protein WHR41_08100 [Cladosporium halotolerans]|uniref:CCHC-type domain-containing protein n=1 Tax=Cladosporium halotolerans TaxID=1052096 RepID=A0AB34KG93_9PEZI
MAAAARPLPQPDDSASPGVTRLGRSRASRTAIDYKGLHRGTLARERIPSQSTDKSSDVQESRLETILKAIAGVHDSVDERFALVQEAIDQVPDVSQVKEAVADEVKDVVQEQLRVTVQREIVHAIGEEVKRTVQQQVSEVVRREIRSVVQHEVMNIVDGRVAAIVRQQVTSIVKEQVTAIVQQQVTSIVQEQVTAIVEKQLSSVQHSSPNPSYADVARTPPGSRPSNLRTISNRTTPSTFTDTLYCTVDVTNVEEAERDNASVSKIRQNIEKEMGKGEEGSGWRCVAVTRDPRHAARIRVTCRDESELARVKEVVEKTKAVGSRVLRDQWYPVKVDNACRTAVLDGHGELRTGAVEMLEKENEVSTAKISWLSRKDVQKAYGSMVVYVTKRADAARLLEGQYFIVDGESAFTRVFEPRRGPMQCFRCLSLGHKAFSCTKEQVCSRYAQPGHRHSDCQAEQPKCAICDGPHESPSRQCRILYPATDV